MASKGYSYFNTWLFTNYLLRVQHFHSDLWVQARTSPFSYLIYLIQLTYLLLFIESTWVTWHDEWMTNTLTSTQIIQITLKTPVLFMFIKMKSTPPLAAAVSIQSGLYELTHSSACPGAMSAAGWYHVERSPSGRRPCDTCCVFKSKINSCLATSHQTLGDDVADDVGLKTHLRSLLLASVSSCADT